MIVPPRPPYSQMTLAALLAELAIWERGVERAIRTRQFVKEISHHRDECRSWAMRRAREQQTEKAA